nr:MAG TPA: Replicative helicase [Caudoviricetes sp.]
MNFPREYQLDEKTGNWTYKGFECVAHMTCPEHGKYPCVYRDADGLYHTINDKRCPICYRNEVIEREIGRACIPARFKTKTFENFETPEAWQKMAKETVRSYAEQFPENLAHGRCMLFLGNVGTGKTHLASALLRSVIEQGYTGAFVGAGDLIADIRDTWRPNSEMSPRALTRRYIDMDLLVIDEIGVQRGTENEREILFSILNNRYNGLRPTVLLSNFNTEDVKRYVGERVYDRLKEDGGLVIPFSGRSYRK